MINDNLLIGVVQGDVEAKRSSQWEPWGNLNIAGIGVCKGHT